MKSAFLNIPLPEQYNYLAPDGSEIRLLTSINGGNICHCTLPPGKVSVAVKHKTVEEMWYFLSGEGEMWQKEVNGGRPFAVKPGDSVNIPVGNSFQFKNTGTGSLCILITTIPRWPEDTEEAISVKGHWQKI